MNTIHELFKDRESLNGLSTGIGAKTWLRSKSTRDLKRMLKTLEDTSMLFNDFQYHGNPKQQRITDEMSRNGGISGIHKLMGTLQSEISRRSNERRINWEKAIVKARKSEKDLLTRNVLNRLYHRHSGAQDDYDYELLLKHLDK